MFQALQKLDNFSELKLSTFIRSLILRFANIKDSFRAAEKRSQAKIPKKRNTLYEKIPARRQNIEMGALSRALSPLKLAFKRQFGR